MIQRLKKPTALRDRIAYKQARDLALRKANAEVWKRDGYCCRCCHANVRKGGFGNRRGVVHHLVKRSQSKALRAVEHNLVLLCGLCHADIHSYALVISGTNANGALRFERRR